MLQNPSKCSRSPRFLTFTSLLRQVPANIMTLMCELCGGGQREEAIILCDACDRGCHMFCLNPPLDAVPDGVIE